LDRYTEKIVLTGSKAVELLMGVKKIDAVKRAHLLGLAASLNFSSICSLDSAAAAQV
jgi:hypothetical protein